MAYDGVEVEIKIKADKSAAEAIKKKLLATTDVELVHHIDAYFDNKEYSFLDVDPIKEWLRVSERGDKVFINHKFWYFDKDNTPTHCDEVELVVYSLSEVNRLLKALGYEPLITVDKHRTEALLEDNFLVSVDEVANLGYFIEIELNKSMGTIEEAQNALLAFATKLGLDPKNVLRKGYPRLLLEDR